MALCYTCKHFLGLDVDGYVHCKVNGTTRPMLVCPFYERKRAEEKLPHILYHGVEKSSEENYRGEK